MVLENLVSLTADVTLPSSDAIQKFRERLSLPQLKHLTCKTDTTLLFVYKNPLQSITIAPDDQCIHYPAILRFFRGMNPPSDYSPVMPRCASLTQITVDFSRTEGFSPYFPNPRHGPGFDLDERVRLDHVRSLKIDLLHELNFLAAIRFTNWLILPVLEAIDLRIREMLTREDEFWNCLQTLRNNSTELKEVRLTVVDGLGIMNRDDLSAKVGGIFARSSEDVPLEGATGAEDVNIAVEIVNRRVCSPVSSNVRKTDVHSR
jgi:hypothetical protein